MTRQDLAERLDHLDPGECLAVGQSDLARMFGSGAWTDDVIKAAEAFAEEHRCTFAHRETASQQPEFTKDDVF